PGRHHPRRPHHRLVRRSTNAASGVSAALVGSSLRPRVSPRLTGDEVATVVLVGIRVVAAEDSYLIREGLRLLLATQDDLELVASVGSLPDLLAAVDEHEPDVVVTDVRMPPGHSDEGIQAAEALARSHPTLGTVILSQYVEPEWAVRLFDSGASGRAYLLKEGVGDLAQLRHTL